MSNPPDFVAVVDDDACMLQGLGHVLSAHGYGVFRFSSAEQYLQTGDADRASCIVIDVDLGRGMSGLELGRAIVSSGRATAIIFITGSPDPAVREQALAVGCAAFLEKPFAAESLITAIQGSGAPGS